MEFVVNVLPNCGVGRNVAWRSHYLSLEKLQLLSIDDLTGKADILFK
jgi:hypothetical protein